EDVEMVLIYKTLENTDGNKTRAAEILDITPRTLRNKLNKYKTLQPNFESSIDIGNESGVVQESFS
ncbi:MAG: helix-turn-helix domain-containing protein, partial [Candidatus Scalindua sediminis]